MLFARRALLLALAATASASIQKRSVDSIVNDIHMIGNETQVLITALENYSGDVGSSVPIQRATDTVQAAVENAVNDAHNTPQYNLTEGIKILTAVTTLTDLTYQSLNLLVSKHDLFSAAGLNDLVLHDLDVLHGASNDLANALYDITVPEGQGLAYSAGACLDQAFSTAALWSSVNTKCSAPTPTSTMSPAPFPTVYGGGASSEQLRGGMLVVTFVAVLVPIL